MKKLLLPVTLLAAVLGVGGYFGYRYLFPEPPPPPKPPDIGTIQVREKVPVPKVRFTDATEAAGIKFRHVNGAFGRKLLPETMGGGVAFFDYDNDGKPDLLFVNSCYWPGEPAATPAPTLALYRNTGGKFEDVTVAAGLNVTMYGMGVAVADIDNDGFSDVFVTGVGGNRLFRNAEGKRFADVTAEAGVAGPGGWPTGVSREEFLKIYNPIAFPASTAFLDYDGDGRLDLFVTYYITWSPAFDLANDFKLEGHGRAYGPPISFEGTHCALYRNVDGRRFEDVSAKANVQVTESEGIGPDARPRAAGKSLGAIVCDPDEDGWPDVIVANDTVRNFFFHNVAGPNGSRKFEEIGLLSGVAYAEGKARGGMGIDWAEYKPGRCAVAIANFADEATTFLGQDAPKRLTFADTALPVGISGPSRGPLKFGTFFFDYDLDGRLDLLTANGHLEPEITKVRTAQQYAQPALMFWNTGGKASCFEPVSPDDAGPDLFKPVVGRGSAYADFDGDGDLDVVLANNGGAPLLLRNDNDLKHHWVRLTLVGDGRRSNRDALGAMVTLEAGGLVQRRYVNGCRGYLSHSERTLTFGLDKVAKIDKVTIHWPGKDAGPPQILTDVGVDQHHTIKQAN